MRQFGYVGLKFMKENRAINKYLVVVISMHDRVEAMGVGKTDQGENRLHSMRKENPGEKLEKNHDVFVMVEEERPTKVKKELEEKEK